MAATTRKLSSPRPRLVAKAGEVQKRKLFWRWSRTSSTPKFATTPATVVTVKARLMVPKSLGASSLARMIWDAKLIARVPTFWANSQLVPIRAERLRLPRRSPAALVSPAMPAAGELLGSRNGPRLGMREDPLGDDHFMRRRRDPEDFLGDEIEGRPAQL